MKKLLIVLSLILALCLCFTACNKDKNDEDDGGGSGNPVSDGGNPASKEAIANMFKTSGTLGELFEGVNVDFNLDDIYTEIMALQGEGSMNVMATVDGASASAEGYVGFLEGAFVAKFVDTTAGSSDSSEAYAFITDDLKFVTVSQDEYGTGWVTDVQDFGAILAQIPDMAASSSDETASGAMMGFISDLKLPELKASHLNYKNGKYVISKAYWKQVVEYTLDAYVDAIKNESADVDASEMEAQLKEIKDMANGIIDALTLDVFFRAEGENIVGFGMDVGVNKSGLQKIGEVVGDDTLDEDMTEFMISFDSKGSGDVLEYVDFKVKLVGADPTTENINMALRIEPITNSEKAIVGMVLTQSMNVKTHNTIYNENGDASQVLQNIDMSMNVTVDLSKVDEVNGKVVSADVSLYQTNDGSVSSDIDFEFEVKALGNNSYEFKVKYTDGTKTSGNMTMNGTVSYSDTAANFPVIPNEVITAKDEALANYTPEGNPNYEVDASSPSTDWVA